MLTTPAKFAIFTALSSLLLQTSLPAQARPTQPTQTQNAEAVYKKSQKPNYQKNGMSFIA